MPRDDSQSPIDRFTQVVIRNKVRQIVSRAELGPQHREDVQQELLARLLKGLEAFDPALGHRNAFVTTLVARIGANILRDLLAQKRDPRRVQPLEEEPGQDARHPRTASAQERIDLAIDLAAALENLPAELKALAEALRAAGSVTQAARNLGRPRTSLYGPLRRLRQHLEDAGLHVYLKARSSPGAATG